MGIKGRIAKIYANGDSGNVLHLVAGLLGLDTEWKEEDHPRDENGQFTGEGSSGSEKSEKNSSEMKIDPDFDIFSWEEEEESEEEKADKSEREKEEKERNDFGQHGLSEKEYPEELRLTKEERDTLNDIYHGYKDPNHKISASADVMEAASGNGLITKERLAQKEGKLKETIQACNEEIDKKKANGYTYKTHNPQASETGKQKLARWWNEVMETGAPQSNWGENGIRYWQLLRAESNRQLGQIGLAKKLVARSEFAEKQPGYIPWRKNPNSSNPNYKPWQNDCMAEDGGPGSGNYGHKGRPGKRGGSGPGGGKQYRGGRADIGYFGSRGDWLNGLQGEKQLKAARAIAKHKSDLNNTLKLKQKLKELGEKGMLTQAEIEERIKEAKLDKINENMTPEEFALHRGTPTEQKQILDLMKESRSWEEKKDKLIDENLDDDEKKALEYLSKEDFSKYTDAGKAKEATQIKNLLEAKAMGITENAVDIPDEIQYESGIKERPAPPEPEPEKPVGPDYSWYGNPDYGATLGASANASKYMAASLGEPAGKAADYTKEQFAEQNERFVDMIAHGNPNNDSLKYGVRAINHMRDAMAKNEKGPYGIRRADFKYTPEMYNRLSDEEKQRLLQIVNAKCNKFRFVQKVYDKIEDIPDSDFFSTENQLRLDGIRSNKDRQAIKDYILLQEKMLLGVEPRSAEEMQNAKSAMEAKAKQEREQKSKEWHSTHSEADIKKMYTPDSISGVSRGNAMSTEEADDSNANPERNSHTAWQRGNCQTCVMAYELRRRGYNVIAKPRNGDAEAEQLKLSNHNESGWLDPDTGEDVQPIVPDKKLNRSTATSWLDKTIEDGQRYELSVCWNYCRGAHVLIAQKENGVLTLIDPQTGKKRTGDEITEFFGGVSLNSTSKGNWKPSLLRVDNALPKQEYYDKIFLRA